MEEIKDQGAAAKQEGQQLRLDQAGVGANYSNVLLITSGPEEIMLTFGVRMGDDNTVKVTDRVVTSPKTAKRFASVLSQTVRMYEERFGTIDLTTPAPKDVKAK